MIYPLPDKLTLPVVPEYFAVPEYKYEVELKYNGMDPAKKAAMMAMVVIGAGVLFAMILHFEKRRNLNAFKSIDTKPLKRKNSKKLN